MEHTPNQDDSENDGKNMSWTIPPPLRTLIKEAADTIHDRISLDELPAIRCEIRQTAERIYRNWRILEDIVQRHEATIQKRWTNKSKIKRRELLLTTWPNMSHDHRPDIALENTPYSKELKQDTSRLLLGIPRKQKLYEGTRREAFLMPYINLHDLTKTEPLLLMINSRARRPPHTFSRRDLQLSTRRIGLTRWRLLEGYIMELDGPHSTPEGYGELREGNIGSVVPDNGVDPRLAHGVIQPGDGLWVLEIQDRIYGFLLEVSQRILHDIPPGDLVGPKYSIQPEPPLPSANSRENGIVSLATTNLEAIYSSPGQMDLHRLQLLVTSKANEEEDKLWAMREDPGRFSECLEDYVAHRPEFVPDLFGKKHHRATIDGCRKLFGSNVRDIEEVMSIVPLLSQFLTVDYWNGLVQDLTALSELKKQHFDNRNIKQGDPLPEPFALELWSIQFGLCATIGKRLAHLRIAAYSSPPLRPYIRRASSDTCDDFVHRSEKQPPRHISGFMTILDSLFHNEAIKPIGHMGLAQSITKQYERFINSVPDGLLRNDDIKTIGHVGGVQSLMEQYEKFISSVPDGHQAVSSYVAQEISYLALLSECLRQTHLFQPWTATHKAMAMSHIQVLNSRFQDGLHETEALSKFVPNTRIWRMAAAVTKSPYPIQKKRKATNVDAMQKAETLLDQFWDAMLAELEQHNVLLTSCQNVLFHQGRQLQRTPDWVEPVKPTNKQPPQAILPEVLAQPFGGLNIDEDHKAQDFAIEKAKIKTRGTAAPQPLTSTQDQTTEEEAHSDTETIQVDRRALKVFNVLFHAPSSTSKPGDVPWTDFLHAMRSAGFWMEKLYGSVWQFTPHDDNDPVKAAGMRSILFHEPHPHSRIPFRQARRHGRRLARTFGWSGQTFVLK